MINEIAKKIEQSGGQSYFVGGYVRDEFLGLQSKDIDIEVYGLELDELISILTTFGKVVTCGKSFGIIKLGNMDFSIPRTETKTGTGYTGFEVTLNPYLTKVEACRRRDITINAIMKNVLTGEIIDPFNGITDIQNYTIRHVDAKSFAEDPLRVLRVAQFAARFDFVVSDETVKLCMTLLDEMKTLSSERIYIEIEKLLMKAENPSIGFNFMIRTGVMEVLFPELHDLLGLDQGTKYHPEGCAMCHTLLALDYTPVEDRTIGLMLAILLHDLGKVSTGVKHSDMDHVSFFGHDKASVPLAETLLRRITNDKKLIAEILPLIEHHMQPYLIKNVLKKKLIRRLVLKVDVPVLLKLHLADKCSRGVERDVSYVNEILRIYDEVKNEVKPLLQGRHLIEHLNLKPGKYFGSILKEVFEQQLDGNVTTVEEGLEYVESLHYKLKKENDDWREYLRKIFGLVCD